MKTRLLVIAILASAFVVACEQGDIGIFASIEQEELIKKGNLNENATVLGMTRRGSTYYAGLAGGVYSRAAGSGDNISWDGPISRPAGYADYVTDLVKLGDTIYVSFVDNNGQSFGLFALDTNDSWSDNLYGDAQITRLHVANDRLFASVLDDPANRLVHIDPSSGSTTQVIDNAGGAILDGIYDSDAGYYVFITSSRVYAGTDPTGTFSEATLPTKWTESGAPSSDLAGIHFDVDGQNTYVSQNTGSIYLHNGSSWNNRQVPASDGRPTDFAEFPKLNGERTGLVVGLSLIDDSPGGYVEILDTESGDATLSDMELPGGNNYQAAQLGDASVQEFFVDTDTGESPELLFAMTYGSGLWRARYADADGNPQTHPFWSWE